MSVTPFVFSFPLCILINLMYILFEIHLSGCFASVYEINSVSLRITMTRQY